jgi:hypothetical protein
MQNLNIPLHISDCPEIPPHYVVSLYTFRGYKPSMGILTLLMPHRQLMLQNCYDILIALINMLFNPKNTLF